jgi:hypothetical protein
MRVDGTYPGDFGDDDVERRLAGLAYKSSFCTMEMSIDAWDLFRSDDDKTNISICELGLYMLTPQGSRPGDTVSVQDPGWHGSATIGSDGSGPVMWKAGSFPILFSHITFPPELFSEGDNKALTFRYSVYV